MSRSLQGNGPQLLSDKLVHKPNQLSRYHDTSTRNLDALASGLNPTQVIQFDYRNLNQI